VDAPFKLLLNSMMAATARLRNISSVHTRQCVLLGQHTVWSMTIGAGSGHRKTTLHQPFTMDAFRVVLDDFVLGAGIASRRLLSFTMALRTQQRDIRWKRRRVGAQLPKNAVRPMTLFARRAIRIILAHKFPVRTYLKLLPDLCVTG